MKKILLIFDGQHFSKAAFEFAANINEMTPVLLTGIFLSHKDYSTVSQYGLGGALVYTDFGLKDEDETVAAQNMELFERLCTDSGIDFRIHDDLGAYALMELAKESRFADLMIISSEMFFKNIGKQQPNEYMKYALRDSECPVIVIPEKEVHFPSSIILAYNGSESSVYAIKQFAYLFPEWNKKKTVLLYVGEEPEVPNQIYIEELASRHFRDLTIFTVDKKSSPNFTGWIADQNNPLLVTGAFGRAGFSDLFRKSFATDIIRNFITPVFIAHK